MAVAAVGASTAAEASKEAGRFFKTLLDDLGKPGFERTRVYEVKKVPKAFKKARKGKRLEYHRTHLPGLVVERTEGKRVESVVIPRWACLVLAAAGAAAVASTTGKLAGGSKYLPGHGLIYKGTTVGALHEPILNFVGGIHIPLP